MSLRKTPSPLRRLADDQTRAKFLAKLTEIGFIRASAAHVNCHRYTVYREMARDPVFAEQVDICKGRFELTLHKSLKPLFAKDAIQENFPNVRHYIAILERINREEFGLYDPLSVTSERFQIFLGRVLSKIEEVIPTDQYEVICDLIAQQVRDLERELQSAGSEGDDAKSKVSSQ